MARIIEHLSVAELEERYRAARDVTEARHIQAIWLLAQGAQRAGRGRGAGVRAALGGGVGHTLQRARSRGAWRPAAAQRPCRECADRSRAGSTRRAAAHPARGWRALDRAQGGPVDSSPARPRKGASAAWLGSPEAGPVVDPGTAPAMSAPGTSATSSSCSTTPAGTGPRAWPCRTGSTLDDLDAVVAERCRRLDPATIHPHTSFHWWPKPVQPN